LRVTREADFERARLVLAEARGEPVAAYVVAVDDGSGLTLGGFWPMYRADAENRLARSTLREYERIWDRRLGPRFGRLRLDAIRPRLVSEWRAELLAGGVGAEAVRYAMVLLQAMFTLAIEWGEAQANPVSVVRKPRQGRQRAVEPLTPEDIESLRWVLLDAGDLRSATLVSVLAYAGLRPGEALGLEWRHVRDRTLLVEQAVSDGRLKRQKTNRIYRTVDLLAPLADDLAEWNIASHAQASNAFIFPRPDGEPWRGDDWSNWRNRTFHPAAARAGLDRPRPYDLRHAFASLLIREQRTSIVELAEQLGHAPTMTLSTYTHVFREHRRSEPVDVTEWIQRARIVAD
jgi:integrase